MLHVSPQTTLACFLLWWFFARPRPRRYHLSKALLMNQTLRRLSMRYCPIRDKGAGYISQALAVNSTLQELQLADCGIGVAGAQRWAAAHPWPPNH